MSSERPTLSYVITALNGAVMDLEQRFSDPELKNKPLELLKAFKQLKDFNSQIKGLYNVLYHLEDELDSNTIPDMLESFGYDALKGGGFTYSLAARTFASIPIDKREEGQKWLKDNGLGSIIVETVNSKTLSTVIKDYIQTNGLKPPEDIIKVHQKRYISIRKN